MPNTEKYIGESAVAEKPQKKISFILKDGVVTSPKIAPSSILYSHLSPAVKEILNSSIPVGGAIGQVLAKKSNDDYDTEWVEQSGGDDAFTIQEIDSLLNF